MLLALGFIVGLVGGALLLPHRGSAPPTTASQPAVTPAPPGANPLRPAVPSDPAASVLSGLVLHQADVGATETVAPIIGGTQVAGGATLELRREKDRTG